MTTRAAQAADRRVVTKRAAQAAVWAASAAIGIWLVLDVVRQRALGVDDPGLYFVVVATTVAAVAANGVARSDRHAVLAVLMLWWLVAAVGSDAGVMWPDSRLASTTYFVFTGVVIGAYVHMALAYPSGRVEGRNDRLFVVATYTVALAWIAIPALFYPGCTSCAPAVPSLAFTGSTFDYSGIGTAFEWIFIVLGGVFVGLIVGRLRSWPRGARLTMVPLAVAGLFATVHFIIRQAAILTTWSQASAALDWADRINLVAVPVAIFVGVLAVRRRRGPLGDLVVELGNAPPGQVRAALARSMGDPSLELALWLPDHGGFVDETGAALDVSKHVGGGRALTVIGPPERPLAAIVHDDRLVGQRPVLEAAGSAALLAFENARLQAELRAQLLELQASRARLVAAGDAERRRLERDLHDGAQQRLLALGLALQLLQNERPDARLLSEAQDQLQAALHELRELARGIHPAILNEKGLQAAINSLIDRSPIPVRTDIECDRLPSPVEIAAYFVVSEALANIVKHAEAQAVSISVRLVDDRLVIEVSDNGHGGATCNAGSGLQGLADRIGALSGSFRLESPAGLGTTVHAEIPCASS